MLIIIIFVIIIKENMVNIQNIYNDMCNGEHCPYQIYNKLK